MKKITLLAIIVFFTFSLQSQNEPEASARKGKRIFAGISYSYMSIDMKLSDLTLHSEWFGSDLGTTELSKEEIDEINDYIVRSSTINALTLNIGMDFMDRQESDFIISGNLFLGIARNLTVVENSQTGNQEYSFNSGFSKPCLGVGFDIGYSFSKHWGLSLKPYIIGSMGKTTNIQDDINPDPLNFDAKKEDKYQTLYFRSSLFASYTIGPVTVYAGPGFYYCWSKHEYRRQYTNKETGASVVEEITPVSVPENFIDGSIAVSWKIIESLALYIHAGIGHDVMADAGIHYNF